MRKPREKFTFNEQRQAKKFRKASEKGWRRTRRGPCDERQRGMEFGQVDLLGRVRTEKAPLDCGGQKDDCLCQGPANFSGKGPESKYFWF